MLFGVALAGGDLYVQAEGEIVVDGEPVGQVAPALVRGLEVGPHQLRVVSGCEVGELAVEIREGLVTRAEPELAPATGTLLVSSTPEGADVRREGLSLGHTPAEVTLPCGPSRVSVVLDGYHPVQHDLTLVPDERRDLTLELEPLRFGTLVVVPDPIEASVLVDERVLGQGPVTVEGLLVGDHVVEVRQLGLPSVRRTVTVVEDEVERLEVSLVAAWAGPELAPAAQLEAARERRARIRQRALATTLAGLGAGAAALGGVTWSHAHDAYGTYLALERQDEAEVWYAEQIRPRQVAVVVDLSVAAALWGAGTWIWVRS